MTVAEYREVTVENDRSQLIDGAMVVDSPRPLHQLGQMRIVSALDAWTQAGPGRGLALPTIDVELTDRDLYAPDVVWIAEERVPEDLSVVVEHIPDLLVEIRSPSTWRYDNGRKRAMYEARGVSELWLVDPYAEVVTVWRRSHPHAASFDVELRWAAGDSLRSPQLPGFELPLERVFRR